MRARSRSDLLWLAVLLAIAAALAAWRGRPHGGQAPVTTASSSASAVASAAASPTARRMETHVVLVDNAPVGEGVWPMEDLILPGPCIAFHLQRRNRQSVIRLLGERFPGMRVRVFSAVEALKLAGEPTVPEQVVTVADGGMLLLGKKGLAPSGGLLVVALGAAADTDAIRALLSDPDRR